jgi:hypothetical protein
MKAALYLVAFFLFIQNGFGQGKAYRDSVDNIIMKQIKKGSKHFNDKDKEAKRHYWYNKTSNQIVGVVIVNVIRHSAFYYDFLNTELIKMKIDLPYSEMPSSRGKPMGSAYYFKEGVLVDKFELNFPEIDIEKYKQEGLELYKRAEIYLKNKGVFK